MKLYGYLLLLFSFALTGCDFGEDKAVEKVVGGGEPRRYFSVSSVTVAEGDTATFTVAFNRAHSEPMTVPYMTVNATAQAGTDYIPASGLLTFAPGETSKSFSVTTIDDPEVEGQEFFLVLFGMGTGYDLGPSPVSVTGVINDTDTPKTLHAFGSAAPEGNGLQFTVNLSGASDFPVSVNYSTSDGTATFADSDYASTSGNLIFAPGETTKTVLVNTIADSHFEHDETFTFTLSGGANYTLAGSTMAATGTIINEDSRPTVFFAPASAAEGSDVEFTVNLSSRSYETITINYATSNGTAGASDYTPASGSLSFAPGEAAKTIHVSTTADLIFEADETFVLTLSGGANYTLAGSTLTGTGTITNNDNQPTIAIDSVAVTEGGSLAFTATLSNPSSQAITVNYATADGTATLSDSDYTAASGTLSFAAGETVKSVSVNTTADARFEADETLSVLLSGGSNYNSAGSALTGTGTILNDDSAPTIAINNVSAAEGSPLSFTVALSSSSYQAITVNYAASDGTATLADSDYTAASGTLSFAPGETSKTITVNSASDSHYEADESLTVTLSGGANYTGAGSTLAGIGTITNNDARPTVSVSNASATEGSPIGFTVQLSHRSFESVTLNYSTSHGTAGAADYTAASGSLVFAAGETSKILSVNTTAETIYEADETLTLTLSGGSNYTAAGSTLTATGTILNDDTQPTLAIDSVSETEGAVLSFSVALSNPSYQTITVNYATANGTALSTDADYTPASGTLTFAPGETAKSVNVNSISDNKFEADETFTVNLSGGGNYDSAGSTLAGTGTIVNDDSAPTIAINSVSAAEGSPLSFTVSLSSPSSQGITIDYATADSTATLADSDYTAASGTLSFAPGETSKTIAVNTTSDSHYEANETLSVTLSGGTNYTGAGSTLAGTGTITNNDSRPTISVGGASATEGSNVEFTVQLSHRSFESVSIDFATSHGSAGSADYTAASGNLVFAAGETSKTISIATTADANLEPNETFTLTLSGGGNYTAAGSTLSATGTINNDDSAPTISIADTSATEGGDLTFTVTLSASSYQTVTINYATANGTATTGDSDYSAASGTLTFSAGDISKTITVSTTADTKYEANETLAVNLSGGSNYTAAGSTLTATGTINNDDSAPTISIAAASAAEGADVEFTLSLSSASSQTITVNYALSDGTATAADSDYTSSSGTITFSPGETSKTLSIPTVADTKYEADETFTVTLSGGSYYTIAGSTLSATGTINNDDSVPTVSIGSASGNEGGSITFTVTQDRLSSLATSFSYATSSGSATSGADFTSTSGTATISAGAASVTISVPAADDAVEELDESFTLALSSPSNATIGTSTGTGTIVDTVIWMNFTASLPAGAAFSRASAGTYVDSSGHLASASANTPRFDRNPATLSALGLLMEPASANLLVRSEQFEDSSWDKSNLTPISANDSDSASPDGNNTAAESLQESSDAAPSIHSASQAVGTPISAGSMVHFTLYAKPDSSNPRNHLRLKIGTASHNIYANFDLTGSNSPTTGSTGNGGGQLQASLQDAGGGWKRLRLSGIASTSATSLTASIILQSSFGGSESYLGDGSRAVNVWGAQLEAGNAVPTSYIPTTSAALSRSADLLQIVDFSGFSGAFGNGNQFTAITDLSRPFYEANAAGEATASAFCDSLSCAGERIATVFEPSGSRYGAQSKVAGTVQGGSFSGTISPGAHSVYQVGFVKNGAALTSYVNGTGYAASGAISFPTANQLHLGENLGGHLRKFTLRPRAVGASAMGSLTSD